MHDKSLMRGCLSLMAMAAYEPKGAAPIEVGDLMVQCVLGRKHGDDPGPEYPGLVPSFTATRFAPMDTPSWARLDVRVFEGELAEFSERLNVYIETFPAPASQSGNQEKRS